MSQERRNYRKLYVRIWNNPDFRTQSDAFKTLTTYLLTGPQTNRLGLFKFSLAQAGEDLNKSPRAVALLLEQVCATFEWKYDAAASVLWIPSWWEYNPLADNEKNLKGYLSDLNDMPRTALIADFCAQLEHVPASLRHLITDWLPKLTPKVSPSDHRSDTASNTDRSTKTKTKTLNKDTVTETVTIAPSEPRSTPPQPVRPAFEHYDRSFKAKYGGKPEYAPGKDGKRMSDLLKKHGLEEVCRRLDWFFASVDPWIQRSGHTLDVFFSAGCQTKLIAEQGRDPLLSDTARHNLVAGEEAERLIQEAEHGRRTQH